MYDISHLPVATGSSDVQVFTGNSVTAGGEWQTWNKPSGKSMLHILLIGKGGNGGTGVVGAVSTAAGGGGGGSGGQTSLTIPLSLVPDRLFLSLAGQSSTTTLASYITVFPNTVANNTLAYAAGGGNGGNAAGATAGAVGAAASAATAALMPLGFAFTKLVLGGQAGIIGGTTGASAALTLPVTGLIVTGGTGGAGLGATALPGANAGGFTTAGIFTENPQPGGLGGTTATTNPTRGSDGRIVLFPYGYMYGGTGGGATHGSATAGGNTQAAGGNGAWGCGGGGMGGAFTGSTAAVFSKGGPALAILTCW
jgi:hypothetical protein